MNKQRRTASTFTFDEAFPLIARNIKASWRDPQSFVSRTEIIEALKQDSDARKIIEAAQRRRPNEPLEEIAGNMVDWFSQRWTMNERRTTGKDRWDSLFELFERAKDGRRWSYQPAAGVQQVDVIFEAAKVQASANVYEHSALARRTCVEHYGTNCFICGFSIGAVYGKTFNGIMHVHHLRALGEIGERHSVDPIADLRPVCANCHLVLHTRTPAYSIQELQPVLRGTQSEGFNLH